MKESLKESLLNEGEGKEKEELANPPVVGFKWDIFLSYRVNTDQETVREMYNEMMSLWSRRKGFVEEEDQDVPGKKILKQDPCAAIHSEHINLNEIKIFVDYECLKQGEDWAEGFCDGLVDSLMFVPFLSWHEVDSKQVGSVGGLSALDPGSGKDWTDNVLLEYELALAIREQHPLKTTILPVFTGPKDDRGYLPFPFHKVSQLSNERSLKTKQELAKCCAKYGITISSRAMKRGIRDTVQSILNIQGLKMSDYGLIAVEKVSEKLYLASRRLNMKATRVERLEKTKEYIKICLRAMYVVGILIAVGFILAEIQSPITDWTMWAWLVGYFLIVLIVILCTNTHVHDEMMMIEAERKEDEIKEQKILRECQVQDIV